MADRYDEIVDKIFGDGKSYVAGCLRREVFVQALRDVQRETARSAIRFCCNSRWPDLVGTDQFEKGFEEVCEPFLKGGK